MIRRRTRDNVLDAVCFLAAMGGICMFWFTIAALLEPTLP